MWFSQRQTWGFLLVNCVTFFQSVPVFPVAVVLRRPTTGGSSPAAVGPDPELYEDEDPVGAASVDAAAPNPVEVEQGATFAELEEAATIDEDLVRRTVRVDGELEAEVLHADEFRHDGDDDHDTQTAEDHDRRLRNDPQGSFLNLEAMRRSRGTTSDHAADKMLEGDGVRGRSRVEGWTKNLVLGGVAQPTVAANGTNAPPNFPANNIRISREACEFSSLNTAAKCLAAQKELQTGNLPLQKMTTLKSQCWYGKNSHKYPELPGCFINVKGPDAGGTAAFSDCGLASYYKVAGNQSPWFYLCENPNSSTPNVFYAFVFLGLVVIFGIMVTTFQSCLVWPGKLPRTVWMLLLGALLHIMAEKVGCFFGSFLHMIMAEKVGTNSSNFPLQGRVVLNRYELHDQQEHRQHPQSGRL